MADHVDPLETDLWFERIELIADGALGSIENSLRHAAHMSQLTPVPLRPLIKLSTDLESFEALLDAGDFDTAARYLVASPGALSVEAERGADGFRATIQCSALNGDITGVGKTVANAVLTAWTTWLLAVRTEYRGDLSPLFFQPLKSQVSQRSKPSN